MNWFLQHIPAFVDVDERPQKIPFETTEELLSLEVVKRYSTRPSFSHFAVDDNYLMEIYDDGFGWWVVGRIGCPESVELPKWEGWKFHAEMPDGSKVVLGKEVVSSCGDELTLEDGTKAREIRKNVTD